MSIWVILKRLKNKSLVKKSLVKKAVKKVSDREYKHINKVWNKFEMKTTCA